MGTFESIVGLSVIAMTVFVPGVGLYILKRGKRATGEICLIGAGGGCGNAHTIWVRFMTDGEEKNRTLCIILC